MYTAWRKVERQVKVLIKNLTIFFLCYFLSMSQQAVSAGIIPNSSVEIFSPKTEGTKTKAARVLIRWLARQVISLYFSHLATLKCSIS
jgi:hypothetical protein